ncbi:hypothetical protein [Neisseria cinerea]|uniref:hypothetical protein n=1 Tax=Neisseria cinerea TaxID=483 RepID=UPI00288C0707|nr:hypothetical protein [Neisseria cinerea]
MKHAPIILLLAALSATLLSAGCSGLPAAQTPLYKLPPAAPIQPANPYSRPPSGTPDGAFSTRASNGRVLKSIVKNGVAQGWSQGYTEQGILRTRILYRDGHIIRAQTLDASGKVEREWQP